MSAAGNSKARCQLKSSTGEEFTAIFNGIPGKGLSFVLQELRSRDYLGNNKDGALSKSPYYWRITPDGNGKLSGEWILRFDEDVKSVIAYSHRTFAITLYDAAKKELARQRVASSNFGTGLKLSFPDGSKPGAYLQRTGSSVAEDDGIIPDAEKSADNLDGMAPDVQEIGPEPEVASVAEVPETDDEETSQGTDETDKETDLPKEDIIEISPDDEVIINLDDKILEKDIFKNEKAEPNSKVLDDNFKYSGTNDDAITHSGGYVKESGISLKMVLLFFKMFIVITVLIVMYMIIR